MKLRMIRQPKSGEWHAAIFCDRCNLPISDPTRAMVIWIDPAGWSNGKPGDQVEPQLLHKGQCDPGTFSEDADVHMPWYELSDVLRRLLNTKPASRTNDVLAELHQAHKARQ